jgi:prophage DNA circulation protein
MTTQSGLVAALNVVQQHIGETIGIGVQYHEAISENINQIDATIDVGYTPMASAMLLSAMESFQEVQRVVSGAHSEVGNMIMLASSVGESGSH